MTYSYLLIKLLFLPGILIGLSFHEFAHGLAADKLGDPTPRQQGRLTIEPWPHIDLVGFICLLLVGFGWAKPVQINPRNFKKPKRDENIVSLAGPAANLFLAILFSIIIIFILKFDILINISEQIASYLLIILYATVWINALLCVFNLFPIPPLDGSHIVANLLPYDKAQKYQALQRYSLLIFFGLILTFKYTVLPPAQLLYSAILTIFGLPNLLG